MKESFLQKPAILLAFTLLASHCQQTAGGKLFTLVPASETGVEFVNNLDENDRFNIIKYLYFYNGGGVATGDVNNDGLPDIFFTANQLSNRLYLNKGDFKFEDITEKAGLTDVTQPGGRWKTGATMADVNGDGWLDIYVCELGFYKSVNGRNRLYINNQDGTFSEKAAEFGLDFKGFSQQATFFDYDLDGDLDLFLVTHSVHSPESYVPAGQRSIRDQMAGDYLFRNDGDHFTDISEQAGIFGGRMGYGLGVVTADLDNDGWPDIYVTNDFHENDYLYLNSPAPSGAKEGLQRIFREVSASAMGHMSTFSMGVDAADLNNDGLVDIMTLDMKPEEEYVFKASAGASHYNLHQMKLDYGYQYQLPRNCLHLGMGSGTDGIPHFIDIAELLRVEATDWSWGPLLADFDNDGWKDIFISNGIWRRPNDLDYLKFASDGEVQRKATDLELAAKMPQGIVSNYAFRNQSAPSQSKQAIPRFENVSEKWGLNLTSCSNGAAYADLDNDGDLDLVVNNLNSTAAIYRNNSSLFSKNNYLKIKLEGEGKNAFGIGTKVTLKAGGTTQMQELHPSRGWQSSSDHVLNFGLGENAIAEELIVTWPGGREQTLRNVQANQRLTLHQADAQPPAPQQAAPTQSPTFQLSSLPFQHRENKFTDFNVEPLMPHMLSTEGPKLAIGDVNGDGVEDVYLCGAKAQAGQLLVGTGTRTLELREQAVFHEDFLCEDVSAVFFDADGDADLDLFVVSGGGEYRDGAQQLQHRLYLNNGDGLFKKAAQSWPATNGSCAVVADFNGDGANDLFIGSRSVVGSYGLTPRSFIFLNDGKGSFRDATAEVCPEIAQVGMVTAAIWLPDERRLAIVGEWMPLTIFDFGSPDSGRGSYIQKSEVPNTQGWWHSLAAIDADGDGDLDLVAGNQGLNTVFEATSERPLEVYIKDFDNNGATEPILTYYRQGKRYSFISKDELTGQLPGMRKLFVAYSKYASSTFEQVFDQKMLEGAIHKQAVTLASMFFENTGQGQFKPIPLPIEAQTAPIFAFLPGDFDQDGYPDVLAVGNFYENQPSIGKLDASNGWFLQGDGKSGFRVVPWQEHGFFVPGEGRDIKLLKDASGKKRILIARNNSTVLWSAEI